MNCEDFPRLALLLSAIVMPVIATVLPDWLYDRVADRLVAETHGNPPAILEMPRWSRGLGPVWVVLDEAPVVLTTRFACWSLAGRATMVRLASRN
jgi:hypothetical protein